MSDSSFLTIPDARKELKIELLPGQMSVWRALDSGDYDLVAWIAAVAVGKTVLAAWRALFECMKYPKNLGVVAAASSPMMRTSTIKAFHDEFDKIGVRYEYSEWKGTVTFANGSWYKYQSLDVPPGQLKGSTLGFLIIDEVDTCEREGVENLIQRVRRPETGRTRLLIGNSPPPMHWIEDVFTKGQMDRWRLFTSSTYENKHLSQDYIRTLEQMYPKGSPKHDRYMLGKLGVSIEGAVYPEFDVANNVLSESDFARVVPIGFVNGLDLGHNNPTAFIAAALDDDDVLYVCGEHYARGKRLEEHARAIKGLWRGGIIFCDHDAQDRMELEALGVRTVPATKDIAIGIDLVRNRLADGRLKFVRGRCNNSMQEIGKYRWGDGDKPVKKDDHAMDAIRYMVAGLDYAAGMKRHGWRGALARLGRG